MRIAIFTEEDYTFMFKSYCKLVADLVAQGHTVVGLFTLPPKLGKYKNFNIYIYYLKTFGPIVFFKLGYAAINERLKQLYRSILSKEPFTYRTLSAQHGIDFKKINNPNDDAVVDWVEKNNVDVILSTHGFIIKEPLLAAAHQAILNKHSAILPSFRGLFPVFWAMLKMGSIGTTVHRMDKTVDTGEILYQKLYSPLESPSVFCYYKKIFDELGESFLTSLKILNAQASKVELNTNTTASYFSLPTKADYQEFKRRGFRFI